MFCEKCGSEIHKGAKFCEKCGALVEPDVQVNCESHPIRKWVLGGIIGGVVITAVVVGVVFATGILGGKEETVQTSISGGIQSDTGKPDATAQPTEQPVEQPAEQPVDTPVETATEEPVATPAMTQSPAAEPTNPAETEQPTDNPIPEPEVQVSDVSMEHLQSVTATSELSERNMVHSAERICDGKLKNAWVEGVSGQGVGEEVTFVFDDSYSFSGMKINAGYQKTKELYHKNSRPKKVKITFSDNSSITVKLKDHYGVQKIDFDNRIVADQVTVTIESVYKGNKYKDTVISELEWY